MTTWDWYLDTYVDMPVADIVRRRVVLKPSHSSVIVMAVQFDEVELRWTLKDIAQRLPKKSERSILESLQRLERRGKIECDQHGWRWKG